jgi:hypothetical protein
MTKKQYRAPKVNVGTVKRSIAAIASRWLFRKAAHRLAGSGLLGAFQEEATARTARPNDQIENELQRAEHELVVAEASVAAMQNASGCRCPWPVRRQCRFWRTAARAEPVAALSDE